jgi:acetyl esterase
MGETESNDSPPVRPLDTLSVDEHPGLGPLHRQSTELAARAAALGVANVVGLEWSAIRELELRELELKGEAPGVESRDLSIPTKRGSVGVRLYQPAGTAKALVVYVHGGGWCAGSVVLSDPDCRVIAARAQATVVSIDYRLAPEHPFPAGLDDCWEVVDWVARERHQLAPSARRMVTVGSSAGGNLATAVALRARREGGPTIDLQVLLSPALDFSFDYGSCREELGGFWLSTGDMKDLAAAYMGDRQADALAAPAREQDLRGLPRSLIITAEHDVLRDEAEIFGRRLSDAGVPVTALRFPGMLHGFYEYRAVVDAADEAWAIVAEEILR